MRKSVFVSYSWDSVEHQQWVKNLVDDLILRNFDAKMDTLETERNTVHLGEMMATSIHENDYTLVVMTPEYAYRANNGVGGVGTETRYIMNLIEKNKNRIIPIYRMGDSNEAIPSYLQQFNYVDFRNDNEYKSGFEKLLLRMQHKDFSESSFKLPSPRENQFKTSNSPINMSNPTTIRSIPNLRKYTELDKSRFIRETFDYLQDELKAALDETKTANDNFDFIFDKISSTKIIMKLYVDGTRNFHYKIWIGNLMSAVDSIYLSEDRYMNSNDNSYNDMIQVVEDNNTLKLRRTMNIFGKRDTQTKEELLDSLWEEIVQKLEV